jgi:hypothetical protein
MKRTFLFAAAIVAASLLASETAWSTPAIGGAEPPEWRFAHAEAQVLAGVNIAKLAESPAGARLRSQFAAALGASLVDQAEHLLLSSVDIAGGKRADVLILSGNFTLADLRKMAMKEGARVSSYKALEIAAPANARAEDPHLAWQSGNGRGPIVLIGTRPAVQAAADRSRANIASLSSVNPVFTRARALNSQFPIWVACEGMPFGAGPKVLELVPEADPSENGWIEGLDIAVRLDESPMANFVITASSEATAEFVLNKLRDSATGAESFLLKPWLSGLKGELSHETLTLAAPLEDETVLTKITPLLTAFGLPVDASAPTAPVEVHVRAKVNANVPAENMPQLSVATEPANPVPPKKLFVRISGLDGGTKSIPYSENR